MPFLILSNVKINFLEWELNWRLYITGEALLTTKQVELVRRKGFAVTIFDSDDKIFLVHIASLSSIDIHSSRKSQITLLI